MFRFDRPYRRPSCMRRVARSSAPPRSPTNANGCNVDGTRVLRVVVLTWLGWLSISAAHRAVGLAKFSPARRHHRLHRRRRSHSRVLLRVFQSSTSPVSVPMLFSYFSSFSRSSSDHSSFATCGFLLHFLLFLLLLLVGTIQRVVVVVVAAAIYPDRKETYGAAVFRFFTRISHVLSGNRV